MTMPTKRTFVENYIRYAFPNRPVAVFIKGLDTKRIEVFIGQSSVDKRQANFEMELPGAFLNHEAIKDFLRLIHNKCRAHMEEA
jgi:hypothetical protein